MDAARRKAVRQSHTKSRGGCIECKRRRVKCDEQKPSCSTCLRRSKACIYSSSESARSSTTPSRQSPFPHDAADVLLSLSSLDSCPSPLTSNAAGPQTARASRHSDRLDDASRQQDLHLDDGGTDEPTVAVSSYPIAGPVFDLFDLELWNHWPKAIEQTTAVFGAVERPIYMKAFLETALRHLYVARLMLALSAAHLAYLYPSRQAKCIQRSAEMQSKAIPELLDTLTEQDPQTHCTPLFLASSLLCWCNFARGPEPGQYLAYSDKGSPDWLGLLDGVRSIVEGRIEYISPGLIPDLRPKNTTIYPDELLPGYRRVMKTLKDYVQDLALEEPGFGRYITALELLTECWERAFERNPDDTVFINQHHVIRWVYQLGQDYRAALQARRPLALVVYAHYMVLLYQLRHVWLIEGWPQHVMAAIRTHLPRSYHNLVVWAYEQIPSPDKDLRIPSAHGQDVA